MESVLEIRATIVDMKRDIDFSDDIMSEIHGIGKSV